MLAYILYPLFIILTNTFFVFLFKKTKKNILKIGIITLIFLILILLLEKFALLTTTIYLIIYLINSSINLIINKKELKQLLGNFNIKKVLLVIFILFNVSIILELTVFNFRSYLTFNYEQIKIRNEDLKTNMDILPDGTYKVSEDYPYIEIKNLNKKVNNVHIDIVNHSSNNYYIVPFYTDEANELYYRLDSRQIHDDIDKSKTLNFHTRGPSAKMKFEFTFAKDSIISINDITINYKIPFDINIIRIALCLSLLTFCYLFRPKSYLYKLKYLNCNHKLIVLSFSLLVLISFSFLSLGTIKTIFKQDETAYSKLANSLIEGKVYIEDANNSEAILNEMENPYDTAKREEVFSNLDYYFLWDSAFYEGHYYVYFGVVPVILFFVPFKLITGLALSTPFITYIVTVLIGILAVVLLNQIVRKYFKKCSLALFLLLSLVLIYCSGTLYFLKFPNTYSLPIATGIMFTFLGLNLWLSCLKSNKLLKTKIALGSLSMALVAGCRPQLVLASFLAIPILYLYVKEKKSSHKELIKTLIVALLPYIIIACLLMYYNYIRFSSPFDFGANYNLTTNDMTKRGFVFSRIPLGLVMYLFNPINFQNTFPYIIATELHTNYLGTTIYEPIYGGIFFSCLITALNLFIFKLKKLINKNIVYYTCLILIGLSLIIVILDIEMAGILARYITDFSFLLIFSAILIILSLNENPKINKEIFLKIILALIVLSLLYQFFYFFVSILDQFKNNNLRFWLEFYYLFQFWL